MIFASGIVFGFFLPGFAVSMLLKSPARLLSSFIISSLILFYCIFWLGLFHIPIRFAAVMAILLPASIVLFFLIRRQIAAESKTTNFSLKQMRLLKWVQWSPVFLTGIIMFLRSVMQPLSAWDTTFRWNFLALKLFELGRFDFYPPFKPEDFEIYFYPDGIPPMISFSYYWLYEVFGEANPMITGFYVTLQLGLIYVLSYKTASQLFSRSAGFFSVAILASSTLFFWSVLMGQETGMTALSLAATVYFLSSAVTGENNFRIMILGGCASALGALSREYGCVFIFCGILVCLWKRQRLRSIMVFVGVALILSMPWYVRNWIVCSNPFYNNPVGRLFAVNSVHAAIMRSYVSSMGFFLIHLQKFALRRWSF